MQCEWPDCDAHGAPRSGPNVCLCRPPWKVKQIPKSTSGLDVDKCQTDLTWIASNVTQAQQYLTNLNFGGVHAELAFIERAVQRIREELNTIGA